jgi:uncharacterized radical SAM superfamily protein
MLRGAQPVMLPQQQSIMVSFLHGQTRQKIDLIVLSVILPLFGTKFSQVAFAKKR